MSFRVTIAIQLPFFAAMLDEGPGALDEGLALARSCLRCL